MIQLNQYNDIMTVDEACEVLNIDRRNMYDLLNGGSLIAFKDGRSWRIPKTEVLRFMKATDEDTPMTVSKLIAIADGPTSCPLTFDEEPKSPEMRQLLSQKEIDMLETEGRYTHIDEIEFVIAKCTHRKEGKSILQAIGYDKVYCPLCKQVFNLHDDLKIKTVTETVDVVIDIMQSIKAMDLDISDAAGEFMKIIPVLKRIPEMYNVAVETLHSYDS